MTESSFTTDEKLSSSLSTLRALTRYIRSIPFFSVLLLETVFVGIFSAVFTNVLFYATGTLASCPQDSFEMGLCEMVLSTHLPTLPLTSSVLLLILTSIFFLRVVGWALFEVTIHYLVDPFFSSFLKGLSRVRTTFFDEFPSGVLLNRVNDFTSLIHWGSVRMEDSVLALSELLVMSVIVGTTSFTAGLLVIPLFFATLLSLHYFSPRIQARTVIRSQARGVLLHRETDVLEGIPLYLLYSSPQKLGAKVAAAHENYIRKDLERTLYEASSRLSRALLSALYGGLVISFLALGLHHGTTTPIVAGVIVTLTLRLSFLTDWISWCMGRLFDSGAQAKRVFEFVDLPAESLKEGTPQIKTVNVSRDHTGPHAHLEVVNYSMSYREDSPLILKDISFSIPHGARVGLIGRTGAGKSSVVQALYRMVYVHKGDIRVDGKSLFSLPIDASRALFTVVPQDPYLFSGTLHDALDPYKSVPLATINEALEKVRLTYPLHYDLSEGGKNLSVGERQLVCLARALLSDSPFLILDEPTSSIDTITDEVIQSVIRADLQGRTVFTIAHRLSTIVDSDIIIEFSEGSIVSCGPPSDSRVST
jgi:ABC-type multidrug transport system fused ATPase/permease subunit